MLYEVITFDNKGSLLDPFVKSGDAFMPGAQAACVESICQAQDWSGMGNLFKPFR